MSHLGEYKENKSRSSSEENKISANANAFVESVGNLPPVVLSPANGKQIPPLTPQGMSTTPEMEFNPKGTGKIGMFEDRTEVSRSGETGTQPLTPLQNEYFQQNMKL